MPDPTECGLTSDGCRARQRRLQQALANLGMNGALVCDPRYVMYFTGLWCRPVFPRALLVERDGPATLFAPFPIAAAFAADRVVVYESNRGGTLVDDPLRCALALAAPELAPLKRLACDSATPRHELSNCDVADLEPALRQLRRSKDPDEVGLIRRAVRAAEASYEFARTNLCAGLTEIELYAGMQAAAIRDAGEPIGEFGNDFQIGAIGSTPRLRPAEPGEMAILDVSVSVRGYHCDLCRSFVVGRSASELQQAAHARLLETFRHLEPRLNPGTSCRELFAAAFDLLHQFRGWSFPHHLGHGIGLNPHETPRLNRHWDDTLQPGDVFTLEPGLYAPELRAGIRIEENYWLSDTGPLKLSHCPTNLI